MSLQLRIQRTLKTLGLEVHRAAKGGSYTHCPPYGYSTYSPWFEHDFQRLYDQIRSHTLVTEDRCYVLRQFARHALHLPGQLAECGVYKGGTAWLLAYAMQESGERDRKLRLFDTFTGMPEPKHASIHTRGDFGDTDATTVKMYLEAFPHVALHAGLIPETFAPFKDERFAFVHIDVDLYRSVMDCCAFFHPRMTPGGILLFDDYGLPAYRDDAKKAVDEFFRERTELPIVLGTGQCLVIKL